MLGLGTLRKDAPLKWAAVIAIRLFFAGLAVFILTAIPTINVPRQHRTTKARAEVSEIGKAVGIYLTLTGRMPASLDDLRLPQERNGGDSIIDIADDPWGRPYRFTVDGPRAVTVTCRRRGGARRRGGRRGHRPPLAAPEGPAPPLNRQDPSLEPTVPPPRRPPPAPSFPETHPGGVAMKVREVIRLLERDGWVWVATRGSHRHFRHPWKPGKVTVSGSMGGDLSIGLERSILRQAGLRGRP